MQLGEPVRERLVARYAAVAVADVEPEERVGSAQRPCSGADGEHRAVRAEQRGAVPEHRADVVRVLIARPALRDAELPRMVDGDAERAVAALRETRQAARAAGADRAIAR